MNTPLQPTLQHVVPPDLRVLFDSLGLEFGKNINCVRPGTIKSTDGYTATIQIAQQKVTTIQPDGTETTDVFSPLVNVPIWTLGGGGVTATFPVNEGDSCILLFNDRELDNWYETGDILAPTTPRVHDLSDAIALVGLRPKPQQLSGISRTTAQLRSDDGTTYVELDPAGKIVNVVAPGGLNATADVTITGNLNVEGSSGVDTALIGCNLTQASGKVLKAGNGATGTFNIVTVQDGIVVSGS